MSFIKGSKLLSYIDYRMRVTLSDKRSLVGTFMAFDRHMNLVLGDCEEYRRVRNKTDDREAEEREQKRVLGLVLVRGENVVSLTVEATKMSSFIRSIITADPLGPPPPADDERLTPGGPGQARGSGRGMHISNGGMAANGSAPVGLGGHVRGIGGPSDLLMTPAQSVAAASAFAPRPARPGMPMGAPPAVPPGMPPGMPPAMPPRGMPPPMGMMGRPPVPAYPPMGRPPMPPPPRPPM